MKILDELGAIEEGEALVRLVLAEALAAAAIAPGPRPRSRRHAQRLLERAARISEPRIVSGS